MLNIREGVISDFVHGDITTWGWPDFNGYTYQPLVDTWWFQPYESHWGSLDDGWPESVEEQGLFLLVWRRNIRNDI